MKDIDAYGVSLANFLQSDKLKHQNEDKRIKF
jgi:hypothetical protein